MITSILVGLTGTKNTEYAEAVEKTSLDLALRHNASVTAITSISVSRLRDVGPVPLGAGQAAKELRDRRLTVARQLIEESVRRFSAAADEVKVPYEVLQEERDPFDFLLSRSRYADVTVLSLPSVLDRDLELTGNTNSNVAFARLISGGVRPIITVPRTARDVRRVFAAYSGSVESAATLRRFLQLQLYEDYELCVATFEMSKDRGNRLLTHAARYCQGYGIQPLTRHYPEKAYDALLRRADDFGADLVVMGNSARSLLVRKLLGETALKAIEESGVPLFLSQ